MNRPLHALLVALPALILLADPALAISPSETNAAAIMKAVEARATPAKMSNKVQMTIADAQGRKRVRVVHSKQMQFPDGTRQITFIASPADVRNLGVLSWDYDDGKKADDQWQYMPSQRKSTRISAAGKSGSFMGSDFTYSDMTSKDPKQYDYKMVAQSEKVDGEDCWKIEARPKTTKEKRETGYVKTVAWVSKSKLMPLKSMMLVRAGRKTKIVRMRQIKKIGGFWIPHLLTAAVGRNKKRESQTTLRFTGVKVNDPAITPAEFTQRRLEKGL